MNYKTALNSVRLGFAPLPGNKQAIGVKMGTSYFSAFGMGEWCSHFGSLFGKQTGGFYDSGGDLAGVHRNRHWGEQLETFLAVSIDKFLSCFLQTNEGKGAQLSRVLANKNKGSINCGGVCLWKKRHRWETAGDWADRWRALVHKRQVTFLAVYMAEWLPRCPEFRVFGSLFPQADTMWGGKQQTNRGGGSCHNRVVEWVRVGVPDRQTPDSQRSGPSNLAPNPHINKPLLFSLAS